MPCGAKIGNHDFQIILKPKSLTNALKNYNIMLCFYLGGVLLVITIPPLQDYWTLSSPKYSCYTNKTLP